MIGAPSAVRAVAGPYAASPVAVVLYNHPALRQDGSNGRCRLSLPARTVLLGAEAKQPTR